MNDQLFLNCRRLFLRGLTVQAHIGIHDFELKTSQRLIIDVDLYVSFAGTSPKDDRIDEVVVFHALDEANIARIADIQLARLRQRMAGMDIGLVVSDAALAELAKAGFDPVFGARPLKRAIQSQIENPLAKRILDGSFAAKDVVSVDIKAGVFVFAKAGVH